MRQLVNALLDWFQHNKEWVFSGAGVAIITLILSLLQSRAHKRAAPSLRVNLAFGFLTYGPELSDQMLLFTVANPSDRPVQLATIRLPMKKGANMAFSYLDGEKRLPCMIEPGTNSKFWVPLSQVQASLRSHYSTTPVRVRAVATDALGNEYRSNAVKMG